MADIVAAETAKFDVKVRPVTNEEIEFFFENGWVKLPALIDRDTAALLLERAKKLFGEDGRKGLEFEGPVKESWQSWFRSDPRLGQEERFTTLALSRELGRNAARLLGRDSSIRLMMTAVMAKLPGDSGKGSGTDFHQDTPGHMYLEANFPPPGSRLTRSRQKWAPCSSIPDRTSWAISVRSGLFGTNGRLILNISALLANPSLSSPAMQRST